jgi:hypothetical protein
MPNLGMLSAAPLPSALPSNGTGSGAGIGSGSGGGVGVGHGAGVGSGEWGVAEELAVARSRWAVEFLRHAL